MFTTKTAFLKVAGTMGKLLNVVTNLPNLKHYYFYSHFSRLTAPSN